MSSQDSTFLDITRGDSPVLLGLPHTGTDLPEDVAAGLNETGKAIADTDWHVHTLYEGLLPGISAVRTRIHRYAIDVNRDPSGATLYPGQNTTSLCPLIDFNGTPIYREGAEPDAAEIEARRRAYHAPYHAAMLEEINRIKALHGFVILYDCHSIRGRIPYLFEDTLPDLNVGTDYGTTCDPSIETAVVAICEAAEGYTSVLNGRFRGGWTVRHYGDPAGGVQAIQMELAQSAYLTAETPPWSFGTDNAQRLRGHLRAILETLSDWRPV